MYRNVHYFIDPETNKGMIRLYTWDENGTPIHYDVEHQSALVYAVREKTELKSIFGEDLAIQYFDHSFDRSRFLKRNDSLRVIECARPEVEFLRKTFIHCHNDADFQKYKLRVHFTDIEISTEDVFPHPDAAEYPINVITVYDNYLGKFVTFTNNPLEIKSTRSDSIVYSYDNERSMLTAFKKWYIENTPDVITGWNSLYFDMPYLIHRYKNVFVLESSADFFSPVNVIRKIEAKVDDDGEQSTRTEYHINAVSQIDYMHLIKKFNAHINYRSHALKDVAKEELGTSKIEHTGAFKDFWKNDFPKFVDYNIRDVELVKALDEKLKLINMMRKICNMGLTEYESIYYSIPYIINAIAAYSLTEHKQYFPTYLKEKEDKFGKYEGAHVKEPEVSFYHSGICHLDVASLYPNVIIALNLSPETKFGVLETDMTSNDYVIKTSRKDIRVTKDKLDELLANKFTKSTNNVLFLKHHIHPGIIAQFVEGIYNDRVKVNKRVKQLIKTREQLTESSAPTEEITKVSQSIDDGQIESISLKNIINSIYGFMGSQYSPIYDIDLAEAITKTGQFTIKSAFDVINRKMVQFDPNCSNAAVYGDTDSVFFNCAPIVSKHHDVTTSKITKDKVKTICKELDTLVVDINRECGEIISKECYTARGNKIEFKRETFSLEAFFFGKKRYILHMLDKEGEYVNKYKYTGVEVKRKEIPEKVAAILIDLYKKICEDRIDYVKFKEHMAKVWELYNSMPIDEISTYKGYRTHKNETGYMTLEKGAGAHVRAAIYYNQLLKDMKLEKKYEYIRVGDKLRFVYVNPDNNWKIDVIGYKDSYPQEFKGLFAFDYRLMFEKAMENPIKSICKAMKWPRYNLNDVNVSCDIMNLI